MTNDHCWVLDVTMDDDSGLRAFCPLDDNGSVVVVGLTLITDRPDGKIVGVFSERGPEHVEEWSKTHPETLADLGLASPPDAVSPA